MADNNGNWTFNNTGTALADGTYVFTATATDPSGNVSALSLPYGVTIDTAPPPAPIIAGIVGGSMRAPRITTTASNPILFGTAQPYSQVTFYCGVDGAGDDRGQCAMGTGTSATPTSGAYFGASYGITAQASDMAGNVSAASATSP